MGPSPCNEQCASGHCYKEHCPIKEFWEGWVPADKPEAPTSPRQQPKSSSSKSLSSVRDYRAIVSVAGDLRGRTTAIREVKYFLESKDSLSLVSLVNFLEEREQYYFETYQKRWHEEIEATNKLTTLTDLQDSDVQSQDKGHSKAQG